MQGKNDELVLVIGAAVVLYLIMNNQGVSAAQAAINSTNLTANANVANAQSLATGATALSSDLSNLIGAWS
jgi:hypothetical protein